MLEAVFGRVPMSDEVHERADEVQHRLAETGRHRSAGPVDLLAAATAEHQRLILLCDDRDYEVVASVTGQPVRRITDVPVAGGSGSETPSGRAGGVPGR